MYNLLDRRRDMNIWLRGITRPSGPDEASRRSAASGLCERRLMALWIHVYVSDAIRLGGERVAGIFHIRERDSTWRQDQVVVLPLSPHFPFHQPILPLHQIFFSYPRRWQLTGDFSGVASANGGSDQLLSYCLHTRLPLENAVKSQEQLQ
ncbi:hypothetical protein EVAR_37393_1 [Eumeta japonica]|uniref:Uncharacterized protein n=1 Tax=Eumeta variegata TaxID=151549 RepID=A0A4C1WEQ5_EUMVA|nr:hypothetical protein EVAR_37393_1 [Eumeta japonica]